MFNSVKARHKTDTDQVQPIDDNTENIPSHTTNMRTFNVTGEEEFEDKNSLSSETRSCFEREEVKAMEEGQCMNLRGKKCLNIPYKGKNYADRRLISSTANINATTLIKEMIFYID